MLQKRYRHSHLTTTIGYPEILFITMLDDALDSAALHMLLFKNEPCIPAS